MPKKSTESSSSKPKRGPVRKQEDAGAAVPEFIEMVFAGPGHDEVGDLLMDFFAGPSSQAWPLALIPTAEWKNFLDHKQHDIKRQLVIGGVLYKMQDNQPPLELATITADTRPAYSKITLVPVAQRPGWEAVKDFARQVIQATKVLKCTLISLRPSDLLPEALLAPWDRLKPKHRRYRKILWRWWQGWKRERIGSEAAMSGPSITVLLSKLRAEYGEEIIPLDEGRLVGPWHEKALMLDNLD